MFDFSAQRHIKYTVGTAKNLQALQILPVSKRSSFGEHEHTKEKTYKDSYFGFAKPITRLESGKASK